jgi:hypothetical protein
MIFPVRRNGEHESVERQLGHMHILRILVVAGFVALCRQCMFQDLQCSGRKEMERLVLSL